MRNLIIFLSFHALCTSDHVSKEQLSGQPPLKIPINLKPTDRSHMVRVECCIPFHQGQILSHLCALPTQWLSLPSIIITTLLN